jgi:inner membrane protein
LYAAAGAAADVDLLVDAHSGPTHGLGAAIVAGAMVWAVLEITRGLKGSAARAGAAVAGAYASHTLLDWLGSDTSAPIGIMALWPFSRDYYEARLHVFMAISRRYWLPEFWRGNLIALLRELAILLPGLAAVVLLRRRRSGY